MKMNITFFMGNEVLNIYSYNNFSEKLNIFGENGEKNFWGTRPFFRSGHVTLKMNITFFYRKLDAKYFYVKKFFCKPQYFLRKLQKTVLAAHLTIS